MAFADRKTETRQRAATVIAVTALEGAAIVALISGLSVAFTPTAPPPPLAAEQWRAAPLPQPEETRPEAKPDRTDLARSRDQAPPFTPPTSGPAFAEPVPFHFDAGELGGGEIVIEPPIPRPTATGIAAAPRVRNDPGKWATANDYPARDLREGNQGTTRFRLTIGSDGRVAACEITASSGFPGLDAATCANVSRRARFDPATDASGGKTAGSYSGSIRWLIPG